MSIDIKSVIVFMVVICQQVCPKNRGYTTHEDIILEPEILKATFSSIVTNE